ncbi:MAG TPA: hypothetical protein VKQ72_00955 [Aggregatilineales bacterium]|nr:hypothetical protein [Aggregatilineales bacterium]
MLLETVQIVEERTRWDVTGTGDPEKAAFDDANHQIILADKLWMPMLFAGRDEHLFNPILMQDEQITFWTVWPGHVQQRWKFREDMHQEWIFAQLGLAVALRAKAVPNVRIRVKEKYVLWRQLTELFFV